MLAISGKYQADEKTRQQWLTNVPDYDQPVHEDPPYDRDRSLPEPDLDRSGAPAGRD
jgi:hypothetical protein